MMKLLRPHVVIGTLVLFIAQFVYPAKALALPSQQEGTSASVNLDPFVQNPVTIGDLIPLNVNISLMNVNPGVSGVDLYLSYNPVILSLTNTQGMPGFFGSAGFSINEVLLAEQCPDKSSSCVHLLMAGLPQSTKTGTVLSFMFKGIEAGTACFSIMGTRLVDADGFDIPFTETSSQCITVNSVPSSTGGIVLRQGLTATPNVGGGTHACTKVTANGTASGMHTAYTDQNGDFLMDNMAWATYTVHASYPGYLDYETYNVIVDSSLVMHLETPTLVGGDVNADDAINILDVGTLISKFGQTGVAVGSASSNCNTTDEPSDINDDSLVNISDLAIAAGNWGKVGPALPITPTFIPTITMTPTVTSTIDITITPTFTFTPTATPTLTPSPTALPNTFIGCDVVTEIPVSECNALVALYNNTNGGNWWDNTGWLVSNTPCSWFGITCTGGHVTELHLDYNFLQGILPPSLSNLTQLKIADFTCNGLSGNIPHEIGNLSMLTELYIGASSRSQCGWKYSGFSMTGNIPPEIGQLSNLKVLMLSRNNLDGRIPPELGYLNNLQFLDLGFNQLTGTIPPELGNLTNLTAINLFYNQLTGSIPAELGGLNNLQFLDLSFNQLSGILPPELGNLNRLEYFTVESNQLDGNIPVELGNLTNLTSLELDINQLSGTIPTSLSNLTNLRWLWLSDNHLTGTIPPEFGNLTNLESLVLGGNQLTGGIPSEFGNLAKLDGLGLYSTLLSGPMPDSLKNLTILSGFNYPGTVCVPNTAEFISWIERIPDHTTPYTICP